MKKSLLVAALTSTFVLGSVGTTFAAENPFSDVPRGHWAYDAVMQLAEDGIVEGYGDSTFRGERTITRYEMAQIIARALAKMPEATPVQTTIIQQPVDNTSGARQSDVDRLGADHSSLAGRVDRLGEYQGDLSDRIDRLNSDNASLSQRVTALEGNQEEIARQVDADRALLNRLAAEFSNELNALNVRVDELEKEVNRFRVTGKIEYTATEAKVKRVNNNGKIKAKGNSYVFRMEPTAVINDHWSGHARIDIEGDFRDDSIGTDDGIIGKRAWAQADYNGLQVKAGKFELYPNEHGLVFDDDLTGGQISYQAGDVKIVGVGGRMDISDSGLAAGKFQSGGYGTLGDDDADVWGANIQYAHPSGFELGAGYYQIKDDMYRLVSQGYNEDENNIWSVNAGYNFTDRLKIWGSYAKSDIDLATALGSKDDSKYSWQAQLTYGNYADASEKNQWNIYGAYRRYGMLSSVFPTSDGVDWGQKGWEVGVAWAPWKNVGLLAKYFDGKELFTGKDAEKVFGRVEFFF